MWDLIPVTLIFKQRIFFSSFLSSVGVADDEALKTPPDFFFVFGCLPILVLFDFFILQVLPDIVHPDFVLWWFLGLLPGSDQSSPGRIRRWVLKDLFRPKVSLLPLLASFSWLLVSLSTSRSALGGSSTNGLHPWWHCLTRHSSVWLFTPHHYEVQVGLLRKETKNELQQLSMKCSWFSLSEYTTS